MNLRSLALVIVFVGLAIASCKKKTDHNPPVPPVVTYDFGYSAPAVKDSPVHFTAMVTGGAATTYLWTFGDGSTSTLASPAHAYSSVRSFNITLVVNNDAARAVTKNIKVSKDPMYTFKMTQMAGVNVCRHWMVYHRPGLPDSAVVYADTMLTVNYIDPLTVSLMGDTLRYIDSSQVEVPCYGKITTGTPAVKRILSFYHGPDVTLYDINYGDPYVYKTERFSTP